MSAENNNFPRLLAAGFLIVIVGVLFGGGVALYRNGYFSKNENTNLPLNNAQAMQNENADVILNNASASTNTNDGLHDFTSEATANGKVFFQNVVYGFAFIMDTGFSVVPYQTSGSELSSYILTRKNTNTSETPNRDTPNGFNTAADDSIGVQVYSNDRNLSTDDLASFKSWQSAGNIGSSTDAEPTVQRLGNNTVIESIVTTGIAGELSRYLYIIQRGYIIAIGSRDVPKKELYDMASSFVFTL